MPTINKITAIILISFLMLLPPYQAFNRTSKQQQNKHRRNTDGRKPCIVLPCHFLFDFRFFDQSFILFLNSSAVYQQTMGVLTIGSAGDQSHKILALLYKKRGTVVRFDCLDIVNLIG